MAKKCRFIALLLFCLLPVRADPTSELYFPWQKGCRWVYATTHKKNKNVFDMKVEIDGPWQEKGLSGVIMTQKDERGTMRQYMLRNDQGVFIYQIGLSKSFTPEVFTHFTPPVPAVIFPLAQGNTMHWTGTLKVAWVNKPITFDGTVLGEEEVTVPAGTYHCIKLHFHEKRGEEVLDETAWYALGVGQVKYDGGQYVKELKSFKAPS